MSDGDDHLLLHALADDEVDAATALRLERRLAAEPALKAAYDRILALKTAMGRLERPVVSETFQARIAAMAAPEVEPASVRRTAGTLSDWRALAASLVLTAGLASGVTYTIMAPQTTTASIAADIVNGHRRSLLAASPIDIASSERHTVRPWFDAKLGVAPPTPDLASSGYALVGGRVDIVDGAAVPTIVYRRNGHLITVVAIPRPAVSDESRPPVSDTMAGYNVVRWSRGGFRFWAVSDLDIGALRTFVDTLLNA